MQELDYKPNMLARGLASGRTYTMGLVVPDLVHPFFAEFARSLAGVLRASHMALLLPSPEENPELEQQEIRTLLGRGVDALLIASSQDVSRTFMNSETRRRRKGNCQPDIAYRKKFSAYLRPPKAPRQNRPHQKMLEAHRVREEVGRPFQQGWKTLSCSKYAGHHAQRNSKRRKALVNQFGRRFRSSQPNPCGHAASTPGVCIEPVPHVGSKFFNLCRHGVVIPRSAQCSQTGKPSRNANTPT